MRIKLTNKKEVYNFCEPYIIAELGSNHNGDMALAKQLMMKAKEVGADCVKFQSWTKDTIFSKKVYEENYFLDDDYRNRNDYSLEQIVEKFSISESELFEMKKFADEIGIDCISTPFSKKEVDFLVDVLKVNFIKVASMDLNNYSFLEYIASKNRPIVMSVGLSELFEIDKAIRVLENAGNKQIVILYCISIYPPKDDQVNLNRIDALRTMYPDYPIGFSDHTLGVTIPIASVVKGACVIEKHFTLDKNMFGWDHKVSATPDELRTIVEESKRVHKALGTTRIYPLESDERKNAFRRSIVLKRDVPRGDVILPDDIDYKRPGTGIAPEYKDFVVGRVAKRDICADVPVTKEDLV